MNWRVMVIAICGISATAAVVRPSAFQETMNTTPPAATPAPKTVVIKQAAAVQPDGYMTEADCAKVQTGLAVADLVYKYGWPASDYAYSGFDEAFFYPIHDRTDDRCYVDVDDNKVVSAVYQDR